MKLLPRRGERRAFRATAGRAGPSVTNMFDSLITWFTPERRARIAFPLEIALGAWLTLAVLLNAQWSVGQVYAVVTTLSAFGLGAGVTLHRVRPSLALLGLPAAAASLLINYAITIPAFVLWGVAIIVFGASAYGSRSARLIALTLSVVTGAGVLMTIAVSSGTYYGVTIGYIVSQWLGFFVWPLLVLLPWLLGELVRSIRHRRALSTHVATVSTQRDAALTRADLEAERTRVARDVHDVVAHSLTVVIAQADGARYATAQRDEPSAEAFATIAQTARDALADVRVLLTGLRHTQEDGPQPGLGDLDGLLDSMREAGLALTVREFGTRGHLSEARALALYRILQEALTNALRHGLREEPTTVELEWGEEAVDLVVTNSALGAAADPVHRGHGIDGMRERASLAGGELSVHDGEAFRVRLRLPLEARDAGPVEQPESAKSAQSSDPAEEPEKVEARA